MIVFKTFIGKSHALSSTVASINSRKGSYYENWKNMSRGSSIRTMSVDRGYDQFRQDIISQFWNNLYKEIEVLSRENKEKNICHNSKIMLLLNECKNRDMSNQDLYNLQRKIENMSNEFDEYNIFNETPNLINKMIGKDLINAKSYLYKHLPEDIYNSTIDGFGQYTLEAIIIYVIGMLFNSIQITSIVRVSTLLDKLDTQVRTQANIIYKSKKASSSKCYIKHKYEIGTLLLEFMIERKLIHIENITADYKKAVVKKTGKGYIESNLFAVCDFDLSLIPIKMNLPMVCKPIDWKHITEVYDEYRDSLSDDLLLSDMVGGYLSSPSFDIYNSFIGSSNSSHISLISTRNITNFNIKLNKSCYKQICNILNGLQKQGFKINSKMLDFIKRNRAALKKEGLLMPEVLVDVNLKEAYDLLRNSYVNNQDIQKVCTLSDLLKELAVSVQKARYEDLIIRLASAYEDYVFYMPAFLDFRGRIYRSGILHFHERDLARSLIVFASSLEVCSQSDEDIISTSAAFKYKKFSRYDDALFWYKEKQSEIYASDESLISFASDARDQYQFISKVLCSKGVPDGEPITQDAAASAYQIMSYFLLNEEMARRTNLLPSPDGKIQDVYMNLLHDLKVFLHLSISDQSKINIIESKLDRKLIKSLFMPLIYGKTKISMVQDISIKYGDLLSRKDSFKLASLCYEFWSYKYPDIVNFMKLITIISWFCSELEKPVYYSIPYFTTKQDYMSFIKENIVVYERNTKKRRRVTLSVPTINRDRRKTQAAACANFIHQKDAYIAIQVVESLLTLDAPIYTVHDNFITTQPYVKGVPSIYTSVFIKMGNPLKIINEFLFINLIQDQCTTIPTYSGNYDQPIDPSYLTYFLSIIEPHKDNKKKKIIWDKKVSEFIQYYNNYVDSVYSSQVRDSRVHLQNKDDSTNQKWENFKKLIDNRSSNFSVHY